MIQAFYCTIYPWYCTLCADFEEGDEDGLDSLICIPERVNAKLYHRHKAHLHRVD